MDQIRALDEQKNKLLEDAKREAMEKAQSAIAELNELGFNYRLIEGAPSSRASRGESRKGTRSVDPNKPCPICGFKTTPPHDARAHRSQADKKPFTAEELKTRGYTRV
jgi:hypothetical protein